MEIPVEGKNIEYEIFGTGVPIVFLHGWGGDIHSLYKLAKKTAQEYKTIVLSLPGFGKSDLPEKNWGVYKYADFINKFLEEIDVQDCVLFGHSFGGGIAVCMYHQQPQKYKGLILCGAAIKRSQKTLKTRKSLIGQFLQTPFYQNIKRYLYPLRKIMYRIVFGYSGYLQHPELEKNFQTIIVQDLMDEVQKIQVPTLFVWGKEDAETPLWHLREILRIWDIDMRNDKSELNLQKFEISGDRSDKKKKNTKPVARASLKSNQKTRALQSNQVSYKSRDEILIDYVLFEKFGHSLPLINSQGVFEKVNNFTKNLIIK
jgi:pimeloyl-ACP methyl ester carboxylesterase